MAASRKTVSADLCLEDGRNNPICARYREKKERVPSRFELFFDLVFVAIAHSLSEVAAEHAGGPGLAQFILSIDLRHSNPELLH
ncbi:6197_t:CDS:2, partial [Acaulospora colombiana]